MVTVNGKETVAAGKTLGELVSDMGYKLQFIAVELNGSIVKKDAYDSTVLNDGDKLEVVSFVGGG